MRCFNAALPFFTCAMPVLLLGLVALGCTPTAAFDAAAEAAAIEALLMQQQQDWNAGDIDAFMRGYVKSDDLRFASGGTVRRGWQTTLERYHNAYPDRSAMGQLTFSDLDIQVLSPQHALVFGAWHLQRTDGYEDIGGLYTLLLEKTDAGWLVVHDHTSQAPSS